MIKFSKWKVPLPGLPAHRGLASREDALVARPSPARAEEWDITNRAEAEPGVTVSLPDWARERFYIEWLTLPPRFSRECEAVHTSPILRPLKSGY